MVLMMMMMFMKMSMTMMMMLFMMMMRLLLMLMIMLHNVVIHESSTVFFDALNLTSKMVFLCFYRFLCDIGAIYYLCFFIFRHASVSNLVTSVSSLFLIQDVRLVRLDLSTLKHQDFSVSYLIYPSILQIHYSPGCDTC